MLIIVLCISKKALKVLKVIDLKKNIKTNSK